MPLNPEVLASLSTPDSSDSRIGPLSFVDGVPTQETVERVYDHLDFMHGIESFLGGFPGVSMYAIRKGYLDQGIEDNRILIFSELMDSRSVFLTANADTIYFWGFLDLSDGPLVVDVPADTLGIFDDMWFRWVIDFGLPGPDRGEGGRYLLVGPGYDGPLPEGGYFVAHARTNRVGLIGRAFLENDDPAPAVERIKEGLAMTPYVPGGYGTSIGSFLTGQAPLGPLSQSQPVTFVEGSGREINTVPPSDVTFFAMLNELVQLEPPEALDPEIAGHFAAIGIVKDQAFSPDERLRAVLDEAIIVANAAGRQRHGASSPTEGFSYYGSESHWSNPLFAGGFDWTGPPPEITADGVQPYPATGARTLHARASFFYVATVDTPAMCMRLTGVGSQYVGTFFDGDGKEFDGASSYRLDLPAGIPAEKFWSLTLYDNQTRSMLQTPQRFPRAGSQSYPTPAAQTRPDGTTSIWISPEPHPEAPGGNWVQSVPGRGWFAILRLYSPTATFFDRSWRPSEVLRLS